MVKIKVFTAAFGMTVASISAPAHAAWDCPSTISEMKSSRGEIADTLDRYIKCMSMSDGTDDCSSQFRRLKYAQDTYEGAVSGLQIYCR